jgi:hypothetical protein
MLSLTFKSIMLSVIILNVNKMNVIQLNIVATFKFINYAKKAFQGKTL